jgi:hypothetical protein
LNKFDKKRNPENCICELFDPAKKERKETTKRGFDKHWPNKQFFGCVLWLLFYPENNSVSTIRIRLQIQLLSAWDLNILI